MDTDDLDPPRPLAGSFLGSGSGSGPVRDLDVMGLEQLNDYIAGLEAEIARARDAIARKTTARSAAEAFFKPR